ncbi:hypothetical protein NL529_28585, partial [Klebsiella pneumoniae]|nr:hypothetical protein [Klebsiella pneumoniae]
LGGLFYSLYGDYTIAFYMSGAFQQFAAIGFYLLDRKCATSLGIGRAEADAAEEGIGRVEADAAADEVIATSSDNREAGRPP